MVEEPTETRGAVSRGLSVTCVRVPRANFCFAVEGAHRDQPRHLGFSPPLADLHASDNRPGRHLRSVRLAPSELQVRVRLVPRQFSHKYKCLEEYDRRHNWDRLLVVANS